MDHNKRFNPASLTSMWLLILLVFLIPHTSATGSTVRETDFLGTWIGSISAESSENPVDMSVTATDNNASDLSYSFHYGPEKSCSVNAEKSSLTDNTISLVIKETSGGACDKLWHQGMSMELLDENRIRVIIQSDNVNVVLSKTHD